MNILHLNALDRGGAARAVLRLHDYFRSAGLISKIMVLTREREDEDIIPYIYDHFLNRIKTKINDKVLSYFKSPTNPDYYFQDNSISSYKTSDELIRNLPFKPDIIMAHWISNYVNVENLYQLSRATDAPILWYLLDMSPFTGGCHYAWDCLGHVNACGKCPALYSNNEKDLSYLNLKKKSDLIKKMDITIVAASSRLLDQAKKASVFRGKRIEKVLLGIDPDIFQLRSKYEARRNLNITWDKKILFFGAGTFNDRRKGIFYLNEALQIVLKKNELRENIMIITAGDNVGFDFSFNKSFHYKHLGVIRDDRTLASAYQASDLFLCPSIEDSGPMMINESIMCGTPVVSFEMGVAPDLVHSGKTGYMAELKNSEDLARGIEQILELDTLKTEEMSRQARQLGLQLCHPEVQVKSFLNLFEELLS